MLGGSGLRAAGALARLEPGLELHSAVDDGLRLAADAYVAGLGIRATWEPREQPIRFTYSWPLAQPALWPVPEPRGFNASSSDVLQFAMVDGAPQVEASRLVIDVQGTRTADALALMLAHSERACIMLNAREASGIARRSDPEDAARSLHLALGCEAIVVKLGARGALVFDGEAPAFVSAYPTDTVWPIGSGDVFSAGYAHAWFSGASPVEAAEYGSLSAAEYCGTRVLPLVTQRPTGSGPGTVPHGRVYLAGPFFDFSQRRLIEEVRAALFDLGGEVFSPLHDVGLGGDEVAIEDLKGIDECSSVLALLDGMDAGTVFECGYARHADLPVVGVVTRGDTEGLKMLRGSLVEITSDLTTGVYRALWHAWGML